MASKQSLYGFVDAQSNSERSPFLQPALQAITCLLALLFFHLLLAAILLVGSISVRRVVAFLGLRRDLLGLQSAFWFLSVW